MEVLDVIAIGLLTVDLIYNIDTYPAKGGCAFIKSVKGFVGGCAANFSLAASKLDLKARLVSKVGRDEHGKLLLSQLSRWNIDTSCISIDAIHPTGRVLVMVDRDGERTFFALLEDSSVAHLDKSNINPQIIEGSRFLFGDGGNFFSKKSRQAILKAMEIAKEKSIKTVFDPNLRISESTLSVDMREALVKAIGLSDILLLNVEELTILTGRTNVESAARSLLSSGPGVVAVKMGSIGSEIFSKSQKIYVPAFKVNSIETTGAGDAYDAAFIYGYLKGWDLDKIAIFANAVGGLTTTQEGASSSPNLQEAKNLILKYYNSFDF